MATFVVGEYLGRKKTFIIGVTIMSIGAIIQAASIDVPMLIVSRIITGIGNGMNTATAPVWQSETTKPALRGKLIVLGMMCVPCKVQILIRDVTQYLISMNIAGFSLSNWMTYGFSFVSNGDLQWRFPLAFQLIFSIVLFSTVPWLPESPRWLLAHGREEEGVAILALLEGEGTPLDDKRVVEQKIEILEAVRIEKEQSPSWRDLLRGKTGNTGMVKRLLLGAGTQWMQQLVGINVTSY